MKKTALGPLPGAWSVLLVIFLILQLQSSVAGAISQSTVTLSETDAPLTKVLKKIQKQTGIPYFGPKTLLEHSLKVTIHVRNVELRKVLDMIFAKGALTYTLVGDVITIKEKETVSVINDRNSSPPITVRGRVTNEKDEPIEGATVKLKGTSRGATTDNDGAFVLQNVDYNATIEISYIGYQTLVLPINKRTEITAILLIAAQSLNEVVINRGYYTEQRKLSVGSISKVTSEDIKRQPVSNPLAALQGQVPGLLITQTNGLPGSNFRVLIRGMNSLQNGNSPLFVIDGVPFVNDAEELAQRSATNTGSPFNTIDPSQIESIEILKDADATAIYGSRGANGVILITTQKGGIGRIRTEVNLYSGWGKVTRTTKLLNTTEYLQMRHEAFRNDGEVMDAGNAYDLLLWDTTRYADFTKELIGGTARINNASAQLSGGNAIVNFNSGINYYRESTVFPGNAFVDRFSIHSSVNYRSINKKVYIGINSSYATSKNNLYPGDLTEGITLPPILPELYDSTGKLNWSKDGVEFPNPLNVTLQTHRLITDRLTTNLLVQYAILPNLVLKASGGYNQLLSDEYLKNPIASISPSASQTGSAFFGTSSIKSWIMEPQIDYNFTVLSNLKIQALAGTSWQETKGNKLGISAQGYTNDELLGSVSNATEIRATNHASVYRYAAVYGRINMNWKDKYLLNVTGRRDASSRFGPGNQFANFGAAGVAWVFSNEKIFSQSGVLSFGKIRASYGTTGNDLIGDYQYLDSYAPTFYPYQGLPSFFPIKLYNSEYSWEQIKKLNAGIELGFLNDRLLVTADWFINKSSNQIILYSLPGQTGNSSVLKNFPGVVQNDGIELQLNSSNIKTKNVDWKTNFNLTISRNKLLEFPNLSNSSYADRYIIGKPLETYIGARYAGIDPATGVYQFYDKDKNLTFDPTQEDYVYAGTTDPKFYGGMQNTFSYKNVSLSFLVEFRKQMGRHPVYAIIGSAGDAFNYPVAILDRWTKEGDKTAYQKFTQSFGTARTAGFYINNSDAALTDASFVRLKNIALSYNFSLPGLQKQNAGSITLFIEAQNLFVVTEYAGADPENQNFRQLPPLKRLAVGIKANL